jgi:fimbrial chaperone protein
VKHVWPGLAAALLLLPAAAAVAGSFAANPIRLFVPAGANATSVTLENTGPEPVLVQAEVLAWSQSDGKDVLVPSEDLVVSPPIFRMAPGASQIVRVGLAGRAAEDRELTYRLFLQEVPQPAAGGGQGISVALRLGLPVFITPRVRAAPQLAWRAQREGDALRLIVTNAGNGHAQLLDCRLTREDGTLLAEQALGAYVLPGATRSWLVRTRQPWRGEKLRISAQTAGGDVAADIAGDPPGVRSVP